MGILKLWTVYGFLWFGSLMPRQKTNTDIWYKVGQVGGFVSPLYSTAACVLRTCLFVPPGEFFHSVASANTNTDRQWHLAKQAGRLLTFRDLGGLLGLEEQYSAVAEVEVDEVLRLCNSIVRIRATRCR